MVGPFPSPILRVVLSFDLLRIWFRMIATVVVVGKDQLFGIDHQLHRVGLAKQVKNSQVIPEGDAMRDQIIDSHFVAAKQPDGAGGGKGVVERTADL